jgi:hypothetical protein
MRDCKFCRYHAGGHAEDCPRDLPGATERFDEGFLAGRAGDERSSSDAAYRYGYLRGEVALESAQNGYSL